MRFLCTFVPLESYELQIKARAERPPALTDSIPIDDISVPKETNAIPSTAVLHGDRVDTCMRAQPPSAMAEALWLLYQLTTTHLEPLPLAIGK